MKIAIIGGKLQGVEAAYLAGKAGWEATVIDRNPNAPAKGICSDYVQLEITSAEQLDSLLEPFDLVVPALENDAVLSLVRSHARRSSRPVLFDFDAYALTTSKIESNRLFRKMRIPLPLAYPDCGFPVIVKPNRASGSRNVRLATGPDQLAVLLAAGAGDDVVQGFVDGPSYSLEILGSPGRYRPLQITELEMDRDFDCKRVLAPAGLPAGLAASLRRTAVQIAAAIHLVGLMDIEVIRDGDTLRVLEIDARLPSQTPICVHASTGANMLSLLAGVFSKSRHTAPAPLADAGGAIVEHIQAVPGELNVAGEHIMSSAGPLHLKADFFGADEAITNQAAGRSNWVATLIMTAPDRNSAWEKRQAVIAEIMAAFDLEQYRDPYPRHPR